MEISKGGTVTAKSYGRPIDEPYYKQEAATATLRESHTLHTPAKRATKGKRTDG